ncbi:MAG: hypothetical protein U5R06_00420 [candidate division KSB1 bacterium]|nr:hypothetical protein [candidate division KSB1 bacterium]
MNNDPHELVNLAGDKSYRDKRDALRKQLEQWIKRNHDPFFSLQATDRRREKIDIICRHAKGF